jgi:hypothetical protein
MMVQDKLANPCQAILMELAICFCQRFGERKSEMQAERRLERSRNATTAAVPLTEATAHAANKNAAHDERARSA